MSSKEVIQKTVQFKVHGTVQSNFNYWLVEESHGWC